MTQLVGQKRSPSRPRQHHPQGDPDDEHRPLAPTQPGDTGVEAQVCTDHVGNRRPGGIGDLPHQTVQLGASRSVITPYFGTRPNDGLTSSKTSTATLSHPVAGNSLGR